MLPQLLFLCLSNKIAFGNPLNIWNLWIYLALFLSRFRHSFFCLRPFGFFIAYNPFGQMISIGQCSSKSLMNIANDSHYLWCINKRNGL
jgi:hypothetical protein